VYPQLVEAVGVGRRVVGVLPEHTLVQQVLQAHLQAVFVQVNIERVFQNRGQLLHVVEDVLLRLHEQPLHPLAVVDNHHAVLVVVHQPVLQLRVRNLLAFLVGDAHRHDAGRRLHQMHVDIFLLSAFADEAHRLRLVVVLLQQPAENLLPLRERLVGRHHHRFHALQF